ncbi:MAG: matrixin family metalloprotease [Pseudohongiellaceae bacterium]
MSRFRQTLNAFRSSLIGLIGFTFAFPLTAIEPKNLTQYDLGAVSHNADRYSPFLGISTELSLWENGVVKLAYNHSGARADISAAEIIEKLQQAFTILENVADLDLQFLGESTAAPLDFSDNIVTIGWEAFGGSAIAKAGPAGSASFSTITRLGYFPNVDGSFQFNSLRDGSYDVNVMVHEMMHLLGLGHSENPVSIMTPIVTRYGSPQADDIAALQAMYGPPDNLVISNQTVELTAQARAGFVVNESDSGLVVRRASSSNNNSNAITGFENIDASFAARDEIFLRLNYQGGVIGDTVQVYLTDPNGFISLDSSQSIRFNSRIEFYFLEFAETITPIAGEWRVQVGIAGSPTLDFTFNVEPRAKDYNQTPTATLSSSGSGNGLFNFTVAASDPEGDTLTFDWFIPGEGRLLNRGASLATNVAASTPARMFVSVKDNGIKKDGASSGIGFGALQSQYLLTPGAANVATYFAQEQVLHIPTISVNGQSFVLNLKLTKLAGAQFKLIDFYPTTSTESPSASIDLSTLVMTVPRLILQSAGVNSELGSITFDFVQGATPIKFAPRL